MALQASRAIEYAKGAPGSLPSEITGLDIVNQAGEWLMGCRPWKFMERPSVILKARAEISLSGATYDDTGNAEGEYHLSSTGAFADYSHVAGDAVTLTAGAGVTAGQYTIASRVDDDAVLLASSAGSDSTADVAGTMKNWSAALPSDFGELVGWDATESLVNSLTITTLRHLLELRTNEIEVSSWNFWGAINWAAGHPDGAPTPILELWPVPGSNDFDALTIFYRAGWTAVTDDAAMLEIPSWFEALFLETCRAFALGWVEYDNASLSTRLLDVKRGPLYTSAVAMDGRVQPEYGAIRGGMVDSEATTTTNALRTVVQGPS